MSKPERARPRVRDMPPWRQAAYWLACVAALVVLVVDITGRGAHWATITLFALIVALLFVQPGGPLRRFRN